jgi:UrcA family protein
LSLKAKAKALEPNQTDLHLLRSSEMNRFSKIAAATLITVAALAGAAANADDAVPSQAVSFGDLNLNSAQGAATLYKRIEAAARSVCPANGSDRQLERITSRQSCYDQAVARAVRQVNSSSLSAYYSAKTGHVVANLTADNVR